MKRLILIGIMVATSPAVVADAARGKTLHDEQCMKCHGTEVYTRSDRFIKDREALSGRSYDLHTMKAAGPLMAEQLWAHVGDLSESVRWQLSST